MTNHVTSHAHMASSEGRLYMVDLGYGQNGVFGPCVRRLKTPRDSTYIEETKYTVH